MYDHTNKKILMSFLAAALFLSLPGAAGAGENDIFQSRRQKLAASIPDGIAIIQSTVRNQNELLEFFIPNSDNHDFIFLTGMELPNATLILCPGSETHPEILYCPGDSREIARQTGIKHVYPTDQLLPDLSNAYTDYSQFRVTQRRFKPLPTEIARILYREGDKKIVYFNFPRFVNLSQPPPERLEFIQCFQAFSPKYEIRDVSDLIDSLRMYQDEYALIQLREACRISGEAMIECMRSVTPGMNQEQLRALFDYVCHFHGAKSFGFPTSIVSGAERSTEHFPRGMKVFQDGDLLKIDAGAEINHYTADIQRTFPASGTFTAHQKKMYTILKEAQEACIRLVRPGVTMQDLQDEAMRVLNEAGGYGKYFRWGTSHFLGMEVHDNGDNLIPFKPGIFITVEPGLSMPEFTITLEDDVLCTEDGYEWFTESIPREIEDIERVMKEEGIGEILFKRSKK